MTYSFAEFVKKYDNGTLDDDATWRAYDIPSMATRTHIRDALKSLGYIATREFLSDVVADYGLYNNTRAKYLLGAWWLWTQIAIGKRKRNLVPRRIHDEH